MVHPTPLRRTRTSPSQRENSRTSRYDTLIPTLFSITLFAAGFALIGMAISLGSFIMDNLFGANLGMTIVFAAMAVLILVMPILLVTVLLWIRTINRVRTINREGE